MSTPKSGPQVFVVTGAEELEQFDVNCENATRGMTAADLLASLHEAKKLKAHSEVYSRGDLKGLADTLYFSNFAPLPAVVFSAANAAGCAALRRFYLAFPPSLPGGRVKLDAAQAAHFARCQAAAAAGSLDCAAAVGDLIGRLDHSWIDPAAAELHNELEAASLVLFELDVNLRSEADERAAGAAVAGYARTHPALASTDPPRGRRVQDIAGEVVEQQLSAAAREAYNWSFMLQPAESVVQLRFRAAHARHRLASLGSGVSAEALAARLAVACVYLEYVGIDRDVPDDMLQAEYQAVEYFTSVLDTTRYDYSSYVASSAAAAAAGKEPPKPSNKVVLSGEVRRILGELKMAHRCGARSTPEDRAALEEEGRALLAEARRVFSIPAILATASRLAEGATEPGAAPALATPLPRGAECSRRAELEEAMRLLRSIEAESPAAREQLGRLTPLVKNYSALSLGELLALLAMRGVTGGTADAVAAAHLSGVDSPGYFAAVAEYFRGAVRDHIVPPAMAACVAAGVAHTAASKTPALPLPVEDKRATVYGRVAEIFLGRMVVDADTSAKGKGDDVSRRIGPDHRRNIKALLRMELAPDAAYEGWDDATVESFCTLVAPAVDAVEKLWEEPDGLEPHEALSKRLESVVGALTGVAVAHRPTAGEIGGLLMRVPAAETFQATLTFARNLALVLPPPRRVLREFVPTLRQTLVMARGGTPAASLLAPGLLPLALDLQAEAGVEAADLALHVESARFLLEQAASTARTVTRVRDDLHLANHVTKAHALRTGYHVVARSRAAADRVRALVGAGVEAASTEAAHALARLEREGGTGVNARWAGGMRMSEDASASGSWLSALCATFRTAAAAMLAEATGAEEPASCVRVAVANVAWQDPWAAALRASRPDVLSGERDAAAARVVAMEADAGGAPVDDDTRSAVWHEVLEAAAFATIDGLPGAKEVPHGVVRTIVGCGDRGLATTVMEKMLAYLRTADPDLALPQLAACADVCIDGKNTFFENYLSGRALLALEATLAGGGADASEAAAMTPLRRVQLEVGALLADLKRVFIASQLSPHEGHYEQRTEGATVLTNALRLPLALGGEPTLVRYPGYAMQHLDDNTSLFIGALSRRYYAGGTVAYSCGSKRGYFFSSWHGVTLRALVAHLRDALARGVRAAPTPGRVAEPRGSVELNAGRLEAFLEADPVLCTPLATFRATMMTESSPYFQPSPLAATAAGGALWAAVMTDAALLRVLAVAGYADVPDSFWTSPPAGWVAPDSLVWAPEPELDV